jgi:hypothetical protein
MPVAPSCRPPANRSSFRRRVPGLVGNPTSVSPWPCHRFPGGSAAPTSSPGEPDSAAGVEARSAGKPAPSPLDAVHADPVTRAIDVGAAVLLLRSSWGAPSDPSGHPVPVTAGLPAIRYPEPVVSRSVRTRFHLVSRVRHRSPITRRCSSNGSFSRPRLACAARYEGYIRGRETPGQEVFLNPQAYPLNFSSIPRIPSVVHLAYTPSCTGLSPDRGLGTVGGLTIAVADD